MMCTFTSAIFANKFLTCLQIFVLFFCLFVNCIFALMICIMKSKELVIFLSNHTCLFCDFSLWSFVDFLVDFCWIFDRFSFECWFVGVLGCWFSGSLLGLFAQLVIGLGSLRQARWRGLPDSQLDIQ